ncbi:MAG: TetR/AcrR family transcriptional regulator [Ruminococcaceae bacterium]|nr:TetR/AcrR family transcriptional regulator [Oscillospiraceae bacterium]
MAKKTETRITDEMSENIIRAAEELAFSVGADNVSVRAILRTLGITNRVFYNRFRNIEEVLQIVYANTVLKIRESIAEAFDPAGDFFAQVIDIVANTLVMSYENKMNFYQYVFDNDSVSRDNYAWWKAEICRLIEFGKSHGHIKDIDTDAVSYAVWCFIRGYNADALGRNLPREKAIADFRYSFGILLDGMRLHPARNDENDN